MKNKVNRSITIQDMKNAIKLSEFYPNEVVINLFRLNENQAKVLASKKITGYNYVENRNHVRISMPSRTVEAVATLHHMGVKQKVIADQLGISNRTVSAKLVNHIGYSKNFSI